MATIQEYQNGMAGKMVKLAVDLMQKKEGPLPECELRRQLIEHSKSMEPEIINLIRANEFIDQADSCAIGDRICYCEFEDVPQTCSIFLDELAQGLDQVGKAKLVSKEEAKEAIGKYVKHPIIITKVEGKYLEICRTHPKTCLYWNMEKKGLKCVTGKSSGE